MTRWNSSTEADRSWPAETTPGSNSQSHSTTVRSAVLLGVQGGQPAEPGAAVHGEAPDAGRELGAVADEGLGGVAPGELGSTATSSGWTLAQW
ncbi:MAG TPA: hypothetical protein VHW06_03765 [Streptosporangiaceae bacterium]|nr:hypothetical protein [Streptosporangiaceae bacterium]